MWPISEPMEYGMASIDSRFISLEFATFEAVINSEGCRYSSRHNGIDDYVKLKYLNLV